MGLVRMMTQEQSRTHAYKHTRRPYPDRYVTTRMIWLKSQRIETTEMCKGERYRKAPGLANSNRKMSLTCDVVPTPKGAKGGGMKLYCGGKISSLDNQTVELYHRVEPRASEPTIPWHTEDRVEGHRCLVGLFC